MKQIRRTAALILLSLSIKEAIAQEFEPPEFVKEAQSWEKSSAEKIFRCYKGPPLESSEAWILTSVYPNGTLKWPHIQPGQVKSKASQMPMMNAIKEAILKASPLQPMPKSYLKERQVGIVGVGNNCLKFQVADYAGSWTMNITENRKPAEWPSIFNPVNKNFKQLTTNRKVYACIYFVIDPDGHASTIRPTRCTRIEQGKFVPYAEIGLAQKELVSTMKKSGTFNTKAIYGDEPQPIIGILLYRSYKKPSLAIYNMEVMRKPTYVDLYEGTKQPPKSPQNQNNMNPDGPQQ